MLRNVVLHGKARELYGPQFRLDVDTLGEAVHAISSQIPGFRQFLVAHNFQCVKGPSMNEGFQLGESEIMLGLGKSDLHIMPVTQGSGGKMGGIGKIIAGVLLVGVGFFVAPALGGAVFGMSQSSLITAGIGMAAAGISAMLSPQPTTAEESKDESFSFGNSLATARQGGVVPWAFGRVWIEEPLIISAGITSSDIAFDRNREGNSK